MESLIFSKLVYTFVTAPVLYIPFWLIGIWACFSCTLSVSIVMNFILKKTIALALIEPISCMYNYDPSNAKKAFFHYLLRALKFANQKHGLSKHVDVPFIDFNSSEIKPNILSINPFQKCDDTSPNNIKVFAQYLQDLYQQKSIKEGFQAEDLAPYDLRARILMIIDPLALFDDDSLRNQLIQSIKEGNANTNLYLKYL